MFVTSSAWRVGGASVEASLFLFEGGRIQAVRSMGLVMDTRFLAAADAPSPSVHLFLCVEGWLSLDGHPRSTVPSVLCATREEFEARAAGALGFRVGGAPRTSIELKLPTDHVRVPIGIRHGAQPLPSAVHTVALALVAARAEPAARRLELCRALLDALHHAGLCAPIDPGPAGQDASTQRLLDALELLYRRHETGAYAQLLSGLTGLSVRQLSRDMQRLARSAQLPGATLRELFRVLRLRRAALLLSATELSLAEVATEVGYGSLDAMGRAMRDAGLPSPSEMRALLLSSSQPGVA